MNSTTTTEPVRMIGLAELAATFGVSRRTIQTWRAAGSLPQPDLQVGRTIRWTPATIETWLRTRNSQSANDARTSSQN